MKKFVGLLFLVTLLGTILIGCSKQDLNRSLIDGSGRWNITDFPNGKAHYGAIAPPLGVGVSNLITE